MTGSAPPATAACALEPADDRFAPARAVADALLYEGYLLYPYRRSAGKNRVRWQFGVLAPRAWIERQGIPDPGISGASESWYQQAECLLECAEDAVVRVRLRFLQLQRRQVHERRADGGFAATDELRTAVGSVLTFDEAVPRDADLTASVGDLLAGERRLRVDLTPTHGGEDVVDGGRLVGRIDRETAALSAELTVRAERAEAPFRLLRLIARVENTDTATDPDLPRDGVLAHSLLAAHLLLAVDGDRNGRFLSLLDPPAWAAAAAAGCRNRHLFPVLGGSDVARGRAEVLICSPILLYDHPAVAPESPGDLHDAAEIDEILSLRTLTLTAAEKQEARATDPRAAAIVDRVDAMPPELLARLHGAVRDLQPAPRPSPGSAAAAQPVDAFELPWWDPRADAAVDPATDSVRVAGRDVRRGSRVRLRPRRRGTDAQDMFLTGRTATVQAVLHDVDGAVLIAVTVDDDPAADLLEWYGRYFQFPPDEIEPMDAG